MLGENGFLVLGSKNGEHIPIRFEGMSGPQDCNGVVYVERKISREEMLKSYLIGGSFLYKITDCDDKMNVFAEVDV